VTYARPFFDLQLRFAQKVARLSGLPLARVILDYTNLYVRFGLGRDFDAAHPTWRQYVAGLQGPDDRGEWTYRFYLRRPEATVAPATVATFGCFAYARSSSDRIRVHFLNVETDGRSPLAADRIDRRRAELAALFRHVKRARPGPLQVVGASWLYNLDAYRRLFPVAYVASARVLARLFRHMPLLGAIPGPARGDQRGRDPRVPGAPGASRERGRPGPLLPLPGADGLRSGRGVL
jgi:hypothetical protein